jgi:glucokinase
MNKQYAICLDVGGTSIKSAIVLSNGVLLDKTFKIVSVNTKGSKEYIITAFISIIKAYIDFLKFKNIMPAGIGIGMCGPMDYKNGICFIPPNLHKYQSLYNVNLKQVLIEKLDFENIVFENDASTFLRGEVWVGAAKDFDKAIGITLGTGLGSAFYSRGKIISEGEGIPADGWVGGIPLENGIVEDKIARRWFISRYKELYNINNNIDVKEIADRAKGGDKICKEIFEEMGSRLGKIIKPYVNNFEADCIVFGGQISKAFCLFNKQFINELAGVKTLKKVAVASDIEKASLFGAATLIFKELQ